LVSESNLILVKPSKRFKDAWVAFEAPGVQPAFAAPDAKRKATTMHANGAGDVLRHSFDDNLQPGRVHTSHF